MNRIHVGKARIKKGYGSVIIIQECGASCVQQGSCFELVKVDIFKDSKRGCGFQECCSRIINDLLVQFTKLRTLEIRIQYAQFFLQHFQLLVCSCRLFLIGM